MKKKSKSDTETGYTQAREELDQILLELEEGRVDIDQLTERVERASALIRLCRTRLVDQEARVRKVAEELLQAEEEGEPEGAGGGDGEIPF